MYRRPRFSNAIASDIRSQWSLPTFNQIKTAFDNRYPLEVETEETQLVAIEVLMRPA